MEFSLEFLELRILVSVLSWVCGSGDGCSGNLFYEFSVLAFCVEQGWVEGTSVPIFR